MSVEREREEKKTQCYYSGLTLSCSGRMLVAFPSPRPSKDIHIMLTNGRSLRGFSDAWRRLPPCPHVIDLLACLLALLCFTLLCLSLPRPFAFALPIRSPALPPISCVPSLGMRDRDNLVSYSRASVAQAGHPPITPVSLRAAHAGTRLSPLSSRS